MLNQNLELASSRMQQTIVFVDNELAKIRTGRANPDMFSKILVNYYDNQNNSDSFSVTIDWNSGIK